MNFFLASNGDGGDIERGESGGGSVHRSRSLLSPSLSPPSRRRALSPRPLRSLHRDPRRG